MTRPSGIASMMDNTIETRAMRTDTHSPCSSRTQVWGSSSGCMTTRPPFQVPAQQGDRDEDEQVEHDEEEEGLGRRVGVADLFLGSVDVSGRATTDTIEVSLMRKMVFAVRAGIAVATPWGTRTWMNV